MPEFKEVSTFIWNLIDLVKHILKHILKCTFLYAPCSSSYLGLRQKWTLALKITNLLKSLLQATWMKPLLEYLTWLYICLKYDTFHWSNPHAWNFSSSLISIFQTALLNQVSQDQVNFKIPNFLSPASTNPLTWVPCHQFCMCFWHIWPYLLPMKCFIPTLTCTTL